ncbi:MAG TPA: hypothetical protein DCG12_02630 [Planctomycetaceae bacterium]|nr:hypothetical protein [Planctomycetaceae bacterium]
MFTVSACLIVVFAAFIYSGYLLNQGDENGWVWAAAGCVPVVGYLRYGAIRPAWRALMDGDLERARAFVGAIRFRMLLSAETRACLDWVEGCIAEDDGVVKRDSSSAV